MFVVWRQVVDGYFVHYFAPSGLQPVDKNIVFVIDTSGSMGGTKMSQTIEAMDTVLQDLRPGDAFNVLTFAGDVSYWSATGMVPADEVNILAAKTHVASLEADGCKYCRLSVIVHVSIYPIKRAAYPKMHLFFVPTAETIGCNRNA